MHSPARLAAVISLLVLGSVALVFAQPSVDPPAGAISESGRFGTRIEINQKNTPGDAQTLYRITQPGSYVLTGDVNAGTLNGIEIASDDVTLDLNGFTIRGEGASGITVAEPTTLNTVEYFGAVIRNGHINGFSTAVQGSVGIFIMNDIANSFLIGVRYESLTTTNCETGITADQSLIESCVFNASLIVMNASGSRITDCVLRLDDSPQSTKVGLSGFECSISGCTLNTPLIGDDAAVTGYELFRCVIDSSLSKGIGTGYQLGGDSIARGCFSYNSIAASLSVDSTTIDSNF